MIMRYADQQVLRRYLAQTREDNAQAHWMGSPVIGEGYELRSGSQLIGGGLVLLITKTMPICSIT
jgi:hypothetical protein